MAKTTTKKSKKNELDLTTADLSTSDARNKLFDDCFMKLSTGSKAEFEVWSDFVYLFAWELADQAKNPVKSLYDKYWHIYNSLSEEDKKYYQTMMSVVLLEIASKPNQDWFGKKYMELGISDKKSKAQLFTPYEISRLMADISLSEKAPNRKSLQEEIDERGFITFADDCIGAGSMMIGFVNKVSEMNIDVSDSVWVVGGDISEIALLQCYIQASLLRIPGVFELGDALTLDYQYGLFTPAARKDKWINLFNQQRLPFHKVKYDWLKQQPKPVDKDLLAWEMRYMYAKENHLNLKETLADEDLTIEHLATEMLPEIVANSGGAAENSPLNIA